jgi:hypothetical protein
LASRCGDDAEAQRARVQAAARTSSGKPAGTGRGRSSNASTVVGNAVITALPGTDGRAAC